MAKKRFNIKLDNKLKRPILLSTALILLVIFYYVMYGFPSVDGGVRTTTLPFTTVPSEIIECDESLDCPVEMKCENEICVDVGCVGESGTIPGAVSPGHREHMATECCEGLENIGYSGSYDEECNYAPLAGSPSGVCSDCGNGVCEEWETRCNCEEDCATGDGKLVVLFKDEDQKIPGGAVFKSMNFTVNGVEVLSNGSEGWIEVFSGEKEVDLLEYTDDYAKIGEVDIDSGYYEKIRIRLSPGEVSLTSDILQIYRPKTYSLDVQENTTVEHGFEIVSDETLNLILDFDVPNSVKRIGVGYMLTPSIETSEQAGEMDNVCEI